MELLIQSMCQIFLTIYCTFEVSNKSCEITCKTADTDNHYLLLSLLFHYHYYIIFFGTAKVDFNILNNFGSIKLQIHHLSRNKTKKFNSYTNSQTKEI